MNALLAEVEQTRASVTITNHGRPVAVLSPAAAQPRTFGQLPNLIGVFPLNESNRF
ncbi:type II toxin-antitoxin system Phd/YefM family antitoxin [Mycolicibacterium fortuitum]|uniref:type II toxin-antitoxin system Phd/YefM family antitoxin n=1 Tax=Mycolicibacterium fortuitum TaxID=1766 RepID=UPI00148F45BB|nr:type II toxin-antitoxin system Phd/YefM family antitoxin [Mycolicibacterium fortuitum]